MRTRKNLNETANTGYEEEKDMAGTNGYAGKIQHTGVQKVNAPFANTGKKGNSTVKTGNDLRTGGKGGQSK